MVKGRGKLTPQEEQLKLVVASNIKKLLAENNKKAVDLQQGANISQSSISEYMNAKTLPSPANAQKIADYFGVLTSDIDPRHEEEWQEKQSILSEPSSETSPIIEKIIETTKKLDEPRQENVLNYSLEQLEKQNAKVPEENIIEIPKKDIDWNEWVAFDGRPMSDHDKQVLEDYFGDDLRD